MIEKKKRIKKDIIDFHIPRWEELPDIDLYLDQLVTLIEDYLGSYLIDETEKNKDNKVITKTMINNYVKSGVLNAPVKKKYTKIHIVKLFVICVLKQVYSIHDIHELITLAIKTVPEKDAYNRFCYELELAIKNTFDDKNMKLRKDLMTEEQYILKNVVLSFANKLYVQKVFLNK